MSTQFFWNELEQARIEKMRSKFLAWKEKSSKRMEEIRKRIESFSPSRTSPASQAPPIQPTRWATKSDRLMPKPQAVLKTRTRNKKAEDSTKPLVAATLFFGAKGCSSFGENQ
jgi:hypothetical protein